MVNEKNNSLINHGGVSKPLDTLIKKVSGGLGMLFEPHHIKRISKAKDDARIASAEADEHIADLREKSILRRAEHRLQYEEMQRQKNIENILAQAEPYLKNGTDASHMDDDWVTNFFDKARIISDEEMQSLWARILAGEANAPGSYSRRTVNLLGDLDKFDAELFAKLCGFLWRRDVDGDSLSISNAIPLVFDFKAKIYKSNGINFSSINHLESAGLINICNPPGYHLYDAEHVEMSYGDQQFILVVPIYEGRHRLPFGRVRLTKSGKELVSICDRKPIEGFVEYVQEQWETYSVGMRVIKNSPSLFKQD